MLGLMVLLDDNRWYSVVFRVSVRCSGVGVMIDDGAGDIPCSESCRYDECELMQAEMTSSKPHPPSLVCSFSSTLLSRFRRADFDAWQFAVLEVDANFQHHSGIVLGTKFHAQTEGRWGIVVCEVNSAAVHLRNVESRA